MNLGFLLIEPLAERGRLADVAGGRHRIGIIESENVGIVLDELEALV